MAEIAALRNQLPPIRTILDFGCGIGEMNIFFASLGINSYGIEINPELVSISHEYIELSRTHGIIPKDTRCETVSGNYWPYGFQAVPSGYEKLRKFQDKFRLFDPDRNGQDPYSELGITIPEIDAFYWFPADSHINVIRLFSEHSKHGAILIMSDIPYFNNPKFEIPANLQRIFSSDSSIVIYQKITPIKL
jgi:SAM-dependent methyltransferase